MAVRLIAPTVPISGHPNAQVPQGYCHDITIKVQPDGSFDQPNIILGNKGDSNITRLQFDVTALQSAHIVNPLQDYIASVIIYNPTSERSATNPCTYIINRGYWVVPDSILLSAVTYRCLFTLTELSSTGHTHTTAREQWVSNEFTATVNPTLWSGEINDAIEHAIEYPDNAGYLIKPAIELKPTLDHYKMETADTVLGTKTDMYVKRLQLTESILDSTLEENLDAGLIYRYGIFIPADGTIYAVKFKALDENNTVYGCLIPKEVTANAGAVQFFVVATSDDIDDAGLEDDGFKRWVGNTLDFTITDNFLDFTPTTETNFLLMGGKALITSDGQIFTLQ